MSESNKKKSNKIWLFLLIYTVLAVCVTFYLINRNSNNKSLELGEKEEIENHENNIDFSNIQRIKLTDKYYKNNIEIKEKYKYLGDIIGYDEYENKPRYKVMVTFPEISGLKNKQIQNKINTEIENVLDELINKNEINDKQIESIFISANVDGNFSDVISVSIYKTIYFSEEKYEFTENGVSFRLDTGEKIKFSDLFTEDASIKNIISQSAYDNFSFEYGIYNNTDTLEGNMDDIDYSKMENDVYKIVYNYNKNPEIDFYFSYNSIIAIINNKMITIEMSKFYEYIDIYNLVFTKESLYENGDKEKINYVFGMPVFEGYQHFEKIDNNTFLGIYNPSLSYIENDEIYDEQYEETRKVIEKYKDKLISEIKTKEKNNKKAQIYNIHYIYTDENNNLTASGEKIEVDSKEFDEKIDEVYARASREKSGEAIVYFGGLYDEYDVYNIEISEKNEALEIKQTDMRSFYDI